MAIIPTAQLINKKLSIYFKVSNCFLELLFPQKGLTLSAIVFWGNKTIFQKKTEGEKQWNFNNNNK